ncbi:MAG: hypothetical protein ABUK01_08570 [Leptospirales bacterium]
MKSEQELYHEGFKALFNNMDSVDAEHFIAIINCNRFDYTKWRQTLFEGMSIEEIIKEGRNFAINFRKIKGDLP